MRNNTLFPKHLLLMIALSIQVIAGCRTSSTCPPVDDYYELSKLNQSDIQSQIVERSKAIEIEGDNADLYVARGRACDLQGDYEAAISDYDQAIEIDPQHYGAHVNRGADYLDLGEIDRAIADFDLAISLLPACSPAYQNRGYAYFQDGDLDHEHFHRQPDPGCVDHQLRDRRLQALHQRKRSGDIGLRICDRHDARRQRRGAYRRRGA